MATEKAPVALTGGAGFEFDDCVAARFMLDMLQARCSLAPELGAVGGIAWEARESGWLADDIVLSCRQANLVSAVGLSLKRNRQVNSAGFPEDFRELAWEQWDGKAGAAAVSGTSNSIGLVVGELAAEVEDAWNAVAVQLRESRSDVARVLRRLQQPGDDDPGSQSSAVQRVLVKSMGREPANEPNVELLEVLSQVYLSHLDFQSAASRQEMLALADCRSLVASDDPADAHTLWAFLRGLAGRKRSTGGTIELSELLAELRPHFRLVTHPDFVADWRALDRHSAESMVFVSNEINQLGALELANETMQLRDCIAGGNVAILTGASGSGKSGLAKKLAVERGAGVLWLGPEDLDFDRLAQFESHIGLAHSLDGVLAASPAACVVVFDAFEKLTVRAQRLVEQLLMGWASGTTRHVAVVITAQSEAAGRITSVLAASGRNDNAITLIAIDLPQQAQLDDLTQKDPTLRRVSFNPGLRPVLRNLKILDWVVRAIRGGALMDATKVSNVSALIEWLWDAAWIGGAADGDSRSAVLMDIAVKESASLNAGLPRAALASSQQPTLKGLERDGAMFRRHERLFFQHDLLADWARLAILKGEHPFASGRWRELASNPRWHGALRLFGVWLLETERTDSWDQLEADARQFGDVAAGSLLLEAVLVTSDPAVVLRRLWSLLVANDGTRLGALLDRFLYVGTIPDPRLREWGMTAQDVAAVEHVHRVPRGHQWLPILAELRGHAVVAARVAPTQVARVAGLFLEHTPDQISEGTPFPGRLDAAELAIAVVEELEGQRAASQFTWGRESRIIFETLLRGAPDLPTRVSELCLQLAQRRDWSDELKARRSAAKVAGDERRKQDERDNPALAAARAKMLSPAILRGPLRESWPDGPRRRVPESFREACLNTSAFLPLAKTVPDVALEVLLAVCIEEPQHDDPYNASHDDVGLAYWGEGYPPLFFKGPFLQFLRVAPDEGLSFVLRLINFASKRQAEQPTGLGMDRARPSEGDEPHVVVEVEGVKRRWLGQLQSFEWHYWSACGDIVVCVLQAVERWLLEQLDAKVDVTRWLRRLMTESASLALAGVLTDLGKRRSELLHDVLRPLLTVPLLYSLDANAACGRQRKNPSGLSAWHGSAPELLDVAKEWHLAEHREIFLRDVAVDLCLHHEDMRQFFQGLREAWRAAATGMPADAPLRLLAERLDPVNYKLLRSADGAVVPTLDWPVDVQQAIGQSQGLLNARAVLTGIPMGCRSILDSQGQLPDAERDALWAAITAAERLEDEIAEDGGESFFTAMDAVCAGIAVLLEKSPGWLADDPSRLAWCRKELQRTIDSPSGIGSWAEDGLGDLNWPSFVAECAVILLARDSDDALARQLVAHAATATQYAATASLMKRAARARAVLGDDFGRLVTLGFEWCALRKPLTDRVSA